MPLLCLAQDRAGAMGNFIAPVQDTVNRGRSSMRESQEKCTRVIFQSYHPAAEPANSSMDTSFSSTN